MTVADRVRKILGVAPKDVVEDHEDFDDYEQEYEEEENSYVVAATITVHNATSVSDAEDAVRDALDGHDLDYDIKAVAIVE